MWSATSCEVHVTHQIQCILLANMATFTSVWLDRLLANMAAFLNVQFDRLQWNLSIKDTLGP